MIIIMVILMMILVMFNEPHQINSSLHFVYWHPLGGANRGLFSLPSDSVCDKLTNQLTHRGIPVGTGDAYASKKGDDEKG